MRSFGGWPNEPKFCTIERPGFRAELAFGYTTLRNPRTTRQMSAQLGISTYMDGFRGGLNESMQHSARTQLAVKTKAKTAR